MAVQQIEAPFPSTETTGRLCAHVLHFCYLGWNGEAMGEGGVVETASPSSQTVLSVIAG